MQLLTWQLLGRNDAVAKLRAVQNVKELFVFHFSVHSKRTKVIAPNWSKLLRGADKLVKLLYASTKT